MWGHNESKHYITVENAIKTCCILYNKILDYDRGYHEVCRAWENVDWSIINPDVSAENFEAIVNTINILSFLPNLPEGPDVYVCTIYPSS